MALFMGSKFPPGLLNPGPAEIASATDDAAGWCLEVLGVNCPTSRELLWNLLFTSRGVWLLVPLSLVILLLYRLVGPPQVDEREEQLRRQWAQHRQRFRSGTKRSSLRGVIKSSYLAEMSGDGLRSPASRVEQQKEQGQQRGKPPLAIEGTPHASRPVAEKMGGGGSPRSSDDGWEDVLSGDSGRRASAATAAAITNLPSPPMPRETVQLLTTPGPTRVTIVGRREKENASEGVPGKRGIGGGGNGRRFAVLTVHAAGHNHRTCFGALERELEKDEELGGVVFYHVDVPGHEEERSDDVDAKELSLEALAAQLLQVTIQLGLEWFVGLGAGAGANVLLRYACDNPDRVAGLILANPSADGAGSRERNAWLPSRLRLSWEHDTKAARDALVPRSFPPNSSLARRYRAALGMMHAGNLLKYLDASLSRDNIPASRLRALNDTWTLILCGTEDASWSTGGIVGFLSSLVSGVDAVFAAQALMDKLRRAAIGEDIGGWGSGGGGGTVAAAAILGEGSKATLVKIPGGGNGGGLLEAKPLDALVVIKLFLNKCM